ncbi:hypothetical protein HDU97_005907 [Phlyctochytrium planicorne]|nr:hypothetical protein HDU97_005907 [Phlyctochytrium planicorne]
MRTSIANILSFGAVITFIHAAMDQVLALPITENVEYAIARRGLISIPYEGLGLIPVYKDVDINEVCGSWLSRNDNGTASLIKAQCLANAECFRPGESQIGLCVKTLFPVAATTSHDGTTCGYDVQAGSKFYDGSLILKGCPPGKVCKISKGDLVGSCVVGRGDTLPKAAKERIAVAKFSEKCGTFLEADGNTGVRLVRAKCNSESSSSCYGTDGNRLTGTCPLSRAPYAIGTSQNGKCGYFGLDAVVACPIGNCIFPESKSLLGFCPEWAPKLPATTSSNPSFPTATADLPGTTPFPLPETTSTIDF